MANSPGIVKQLKDERARVEKQLSALNAALTVFVGVQSGEPVRSMGKCCVSGSPQENESCTKSGVQYIRT